MIMELLLLVLLLLLWLVMKDRRPSKMPPGPMEIPFFGNAPVQYTSELKDLRKKYGKIFTTRTGNQRMVFLCDYHTAKKAYASTDFVDRPDFFAMLNINSTQQGGVLFGNGLPWVHDRRFVLRNLRDLGMGKTYLEEAIQFEAQAIVDVLKSLKEKPVKPSQTLRTAVLNIIWQMVTGKRFNLDNTKEVDPIYKIFEDYRNQSFKIFFGCYFPVINYVVPKLLVDRFLGTHIPEAFRRQMNDITMKCVNEHEKHLDFNDPRDLMDEYLIEMKKNIDADDSQFSYSALQQIVSDLFTAGSETVSNSLKWVTYFMLTNQDKVKLSQQQIDKVVPADRLVSLMDRQELPYVEAFVAETLRHSSMSYTGVLRSAVRDTKLQGYFIPKGTHLATDAYFIHHDPEFWTSPDEFRPERFLDDEGKFQAKFGRTVAFGSGRRQCAGEALARMELYLFTAALLQNFTVNLPQGAELNTAVVEGIGARFPQGQDLVYKIRT